MAFREAPLAQASGSSTSVRFRVALASPVSPAARSRRVHRTQLRRAGADEAVHLAVARRAYETSDPGTRRRFSFQRPLCPASHRGGVGSPPAGALRAQPVKVTPKESYPQAVEKSVEFFCLNLSTTLSTACGILFLTYWPRPPPGKWPEKQPVAPHFPTPNRTGIRKLQGCGYPQCGQLLWMNRGAKRGVEKNFPSSTKSPTAVDTAGDYCVDNCAQLTGKPVAGKVVT